jgi:hypothetical protein
VFLVILDVFPVILSEAKNLDAAREPLREAL